MWGATQPCSGTGSQSPIACLLPRPSQPRPERSAWLVAAQQVVDPGRELGRRQVADAGALQGPARIDVGEGRTAADPVEAGDGAVAIEADRHPPASFAHQVADRSPVVANVEREEAHASTVALVDVADHVLLIDAAVAFREPERDHRRVGRRGRRRGSSRAPAPGRRERGARPRGRAAARLRSRPGRRWRRLPARPRRAARRTRAAASWPAGGRGPAFRRLPRSPLTTAITTTAAKSRPTTAA